MQSPLRSGEGPPMLPPSSRAFIHPSSQHIHCRVFHVSPLDCEHPDGWYHVKLVSGSSGSAIVCWGKETLSVYAV